MATQQTPYVATVNLAGGTTYTNGNNIVNFSNIYGQNTYATFCQITNNGSHSVNVYLNGQNSYFTLTAGETQAFNPGDLTITAVAFDNTVSGAGTTPVAIIAGLPVL